MKYDDASWHYGGNFPEDLPKSFAATHIGMFVAWCLLNGLSGDIYNDELAEELEQLNMRKQTPGEWFINNCDEKFTDEDLNELGNSFAQAFYDAEYLVIYENCLGKEYDSLYEVPDTWDSYDNLSLGLKNSFNNWLQKRIQ